MPVPVVVALVVAVSNGIAAGISYNLGKRDMFEEIVGQSTMDEFIEYLDLCKRVVHEANK